MPEIQPWIVWGIMIIVFGIIEATTTNLIAIWFMASSLITMICALAGVPLQGQIVIFAIATVVLLIATRPFVKRFTNGETEPLNADRCIGQQAVVIEAIDNMQAKGQVKVGGVVWSARSLSGEPIPDGETVTIEKIEGVKVFVTKN